MFVLGSFVFALFTKAQTVTDTWTFNVEDATCDVFTTDTATCDQDWQWYPTSRTYTLAPQTAYEFQVDLFNLEGTKADGTVVSLGDHRGVDMYISDYDTLKLGDMQVSGYFTTGCDSTASSSGSQSCSSTDSSYQSWTRCDFDRNIQTFTIRNIGTTSFDITMRVTIDGKDSGCELIEALVKWLTTILIMIGVCCGLGILAIICCACGGFAMCCASANKNNTRTVQINQTQAQMATQPVAGGSAIPPPVVQSFGPPGSAGPDLSMYSNGLQPGWEAKWDQSSNRPFWVDHNTKKSVWDDPRRGFNGSA